MGPEVEQVCRDSVWAEGPARVAAAWADRAHLLRDLFGNPFRRVTVEERWLTWSDGAVTHLARSAYDEGSLQALPILGDALEEAGCTDADILNHCRQPGEHVRGCWVLDLLLGKE
jgi:hypothetical protein